MARKFGKIDTGIWTNPRFRALSDDAQKLFIYLFSNKHTNGASAYELRLGYVTEDLGWGADRITIAFGELALKPFALRDPVYGVVFLPGWWLHNAPENPKVATFVTRQLLELPNCSLKHMAIQGLIDCGVRTDAVLQSLGPWAREEAQGSLALVSGPAPPRLLEAPMPPVVVPAHKPARQKNVGARLTADWVPSEEDRAYAKGKGWSDSQIEAEAVKFRRYWTGPDANKPMKKDWGRTWANRIDDVMERLGGGRPGGNGASAAAPQSFGVTDAPWAARVKDFNGSGFWSAGWGPRPGQQGCKVPPQYLAPPPD